MSRGLGISRGESNDLFSFYGYSLRFSFSHWGSRKDEKMRSGKLLQFFFQPSSSSAACSCRTQCFRFREGIVTVLQGEHKLEKKSCALWYKSQMGKCCSLQRWGRSGLQFYTRSWELRPFASLDEESDKLQVEVLAKCAHQLSDIE